MLLTQKIHPFFVSCSSFISSVIRLHEYLFILRNQKLEKTDLIKEKKVSVITG